MTKAKFVICTLLVILIVYAFLQLENAVKREFERITTANNDTKIEEPYKLFRFL